MDLGSFFTNLYIFVLIYLHTYASACSSSYGDVPCTFVPALPGHTPKCARPGLTYCEYPYNYPSHLIKELLEKWKYDHTTLITNESQEEYNSYFYTPTVEHHSLPYPGHSHPYDINGGNGHKIPTQSDYFPYPRARYNSSFDGILDYDRKRYPYKSYPNGYPKYSDNVFHYPSSPSYYNRGREAYPSFQRGWFKRYGNRDLKSYFLMRRKRSLHANFNTFNSTLNMRMKRQALGSSQTLCQTRSNFIMPRAALNNKGNWMYVVNMPDLDSTMSQLVKSEICVSQTCNGLCSLPAGVTSRCEQKYIQKRLVALEGTGNQLYTDVFWFPSCCICTITNN